MIFEFSSNISQPKISFSYGDDIISGSGTLIEEYKKADYGNAYTTFTILDKYGSTSNLESNFTSDYWTEGTKDTTNYYTKGTELIPIYTPKTTYDYTGSATWFEHDTINQPSITGLPIGNGLWEYNFEPLSKKSIRDHERRALIPIRKRVALSHGAVNEDRARRLLLRFIGPTRFRKYLRDGFVTYKGRSGKIYQIFPGNKHTRAWQNGECVEELCVCLKDQLSGSRNIPPTDAIIMRMLMLEHSEELFRSKCNVWPRSQVRAAA